jgi:hypothetical protein
MLGTLQLHERRFRVTSAVLSRVERSWTLDIETEAQDFDGERWAPYLYHHGLRLPVGDLHELQGLVLSWGTSADDAYPHPEMGVLYVFSHHETCEARLSFGRVQGDSVELAWEGVADVLWGDKLGGYGQCVPLACHCVARIDRDH